MKYKIDSIFGNTQDEIFNKLGITLDRSYGSSMRKYSNTKNICFSYVYFWFPHKERLNYQNYFEDDKLIMIKEKGSNKPKLWDSTIPKIVFYDDNYKNSKPEYVFKGVYKLKSSASEDKQIFEKISDYLIIDDDKNVSF